MAEPQFSTGADEDLPRTLRRAKAEQEAQRGGSASATGTSVTADRAPDTFSAPADNYAGSANDAYPAPGYIDDDRVTVTRIEVPFFRLMAFFLKAVIAAIPALILLGAILWGGGQLLKILYPSLVEAEILIRLPK